MVKSFKFDSWDKPEAICLTYTDRSRQFLPEDKIIIVDRNFKFEGCDVEIDNLAIRVARPFTAKCGSVLFDRGLPEFRINSWVNGAVMPDVEFVNWCLDNGVPLVKVAGRNGSGGYVANTISGTNTDTAMALMFQLQKVTANIPSRFYEVFPENVIEYVSKYFRFSDNYFEFEW